jgi:hypothetical protein
LRDITFCWSSKVRRCIKLSSAEAEYIAISEATKEIKFIYHLLEDLYIEVILPIFVKTDEVGAIVMSENAFERRMWTLVMSKLAIKFVCSTEND